MAQLTLTSKTWFQRNVEKFENSRFGMMTILLTLQSCIGAFAAMTSLMVGNFVALGIVSFATMASNSAFIAQMSSAWCLRFFYLSSIISVALIVINLLAF